MGEIDIVGVNEGENAIVFGEVKWSRKPLGVNILQELKATAARVEWGRKGRRKRFTPEMRKAAREAAVLLFECDQQVE